MELKLAWRNMRRSVRDYAIYFVTLVIGVAVFYAFNAISSQSVLYDLAEAQAEAFQMVGMFVIYFSVAVACVLGFLVIYANGFLIKRRRREFGMYLMLGMRPGAVSRIVLYETVGVGIVSFGVGILLGFALSQGLSFATAALFSISMVQYHFVFSLDAFWITALCFAGIFVIVAIFNLISVNRMSLADLFKASVKNERNVVRNPWVCLVVFVISLVILAFAYKDCLDSGIVMLDITFWRATILMLVGTLLLFWSLAGFVIAVITRLRGVYLRGLRPFTVRQIASRVNTAFLSLWVVCVMLFFAFTTFSCGLGLIDAFTKSIEETNPYDATITSFVDWDDTLMTPLEEAPAYKLELQEQYPELVTAEEYGWDAAAYYAANVPGWNDVVTNAATVNMWNHPDDTYQDYVGFLDPASVMSADTWNSISTQPLSMISISDANAALALAGEEPLVLDPQKYLIANNMDISRPLAELIETSAPTLVVGGYELVLQPGIADVQFEDNMMQSTGVIAIVPDEVVSALRASGAVPVNSYTNLIYATPGAESDAALEALLAQAFPVTQESAGESDEGFQWSAGSFQKSLWPTSRLMTRTNMLDEASSMRMLVTYLAIYMGFVLLITTAAVLAIQQLSNVSDSENRYRVLSRLGCDKAMIGRSLFAQVLIYFLAPMVVALCHSACAIKALQGTLFAAFGVDMLPSIVGALGFIMGIYAIYFLITYFTSRSLVSNAITAKR